MQSMALFRSKAEGLPDLLNYAALVDEGVVLGKDGSLMAGFRFKGKDAESSSNDEKNHVTEMVNKYLSRFGSGWCMWVDANRIPSPGYPDPSRSHFPDPISAMIDAERREKFESFDAHYETEFVLVLQYLPPSRSESKLYEMIYNDDEKDDSEFGDKVLAFFQKKLADLQDGLGELLSMRRMGTVKAGEDGDSYQSDELVNHLHFCLTGNAVKRRIPDCPMYLDSWLGMSDFLTGHTPKLGNRFISCVAIEGYPSFSSPGVLSLLENLPVTYRWSTRFIFLEQHEAIAQLERYYRHWKQWVKGFLSKIAPSADDGRINTDALNMAQEANTALNDARSGLVAFGYYTPVVVLMHESRQVLDERARYVAKEIERKGFHARIETHNAVEAWLGTLPGHAYPNVRRPLMHSLQLAELLPLSSMWPGLRENPCDLYPENSPPLMQAVGFGSTPFRMNIHVGDVGHTLIFGPSGSGKSTFLALLLAQFLRYQGVSKAPARITAFDKGNSLYALCSAVGGLHYDIGADDANLALCPLADIDTPSDVIWATEWIATCCELQMGKPLLPNQKSEVNHAISLLRKAPRNGRSITNFLNQVQDKEVWEAMKHYSLKGPMGHLLDGEEDTLSIVNFTVFELEELMQLGDRNAIPVLLCLFRKFEKPLDGQPSILSLDEAWVMLGHSAFREKIGKWLKTLRKKNCAVVMATQSLSDAVNSGIMDVLIEQCPTKILLPNHEADAPASAGFYRDFGLNQSEIWTIKHAQNKKQYYYKSPLGRRLFELALGPLALAFVGVSDKDSIRAIKALEKDYGRDWPLYWLDRKGVDYEKYIV